jgi:hypothetical protein
MKLCTVGTEINLCLLFYSYESFVSLSFLQISSDAFKGNVGNSETQERLKKSEISQEDEKTSGQVKPTQESEIKTGGQLFARLLKLKNVDFVFGTTGAGMPDIQDAMVVEKPPKWIQGLHEFVTVCAASGYALASEKPGVALIDRVVGTQNAIGAFFAAYHNSAPLVVFASSNLPGVPIETGAPELHYSSFQNLMVAPWVKWSTQVNALENISDDVAKAFDMAISEHRGLRYVETGSYGKTDA